MPIEKTILFRNVKNINRDTALQAQPELVCTGITLLLLLF